MNEAPERILLAEDSRSDAELLQEMVHEAGVGRFAFTWVERLDAALARLGQENFDVLLLDLSLPDSAGSETFRRAREAAPQVPIVVLTGGDHEDLGLEAVRHGVQDYLVKGRADGRQIARSIRYAIERQRAKVALQQMEERLRQTQKLESLGVLAGGIAHDFNNLLAATLGNAELALMDLPLASPLARHLEAIITATQRAAELSRQMLAYSGRGCFALEPLDLAGLVSEMSRLLEVSVSREIQLQFQLSANLPPLLADAGQLRQAIVNLFLNAAEAIGDQPGKITIAARTQHCDRTVLDAMPSDRSLPEGTYVCLEVTDTGCGMDHATLTRAFDPFFSTKFVGRGLGLPVVLGIVRGHRGAISVESTPGKGTTFRIFLPPTQAPPRSPRLPVDAGRPSFGGGVLLLADDDEIVLETAKLLLERLGFSVLTAADGREAVEIFRARQHEIVGVLLDLVMPGIDGVEALRELRRLRPDVRVLLCSGFDESYARSRLQDLAPVVFLQKPFQFADLSNKLHALLTNGTATPSRAGR